MNRHSAAGGRGAPEKNDRPDRSDRSDKVDRERVDREVRAAEKPEKRERILEAAVRVFAEKGFYNAKVSEIAGEAGVADGTIYLYFKSKDDLLISLFEDRMDEVISNARTALEIDAPPVERLRNLILRHLDLVQQHPQLAEVLTVELRQSSKFLKEYKPVKFAELLKLLADPIERGQRDGTIRRALDAHVIARAIFGAIDELVLAWVLGPRGALSSGGHVASGGRGQKSREARGSASATPTRARNPVELSRAAEQLTDLILEGLRERGPAPDSTAHPTPQSTATHASKRRAS